MANAAEDTSSAGQQLPPDAENWFAEGHATAGFHEILKIALKGSPCKVDYSDLEYASVIETVDGASFAGRRDSELVFPAGRMEIVIPADASMDDQLVHLSSGVYAHLLALVGLLVGKIRSRKAETLLVGRVTVARPGEAEVRTEDGRRVLVLMVPITTYIHMW